MKLATLKNGTRDEVRIPKPPGHPSRELTWDDLEGKFMDCAREAKLAEDKARRAFTGLRDLENCADLAPLVALMCH